MSKQFQYSTFSLLGAIVVTLLVGTRLQLPFAGGNGYVPRLSVRTVEVLGTVTESRAYRVMPITAHPRRGASITTERDARILLDVDGTRIGLYEDTEIELRTLTEDQIEIVIKKGRLVVDSLRAPERNVIVQTHTTAAMTTGGTMSVVYYDWQQRISIIPLVESVNVTIAKDYSVSTDAPLDISEVSPYPVTETTFSIEGSVAEEFYTWFQRVNAS